MERIPFKIKISAFSLIMIISGCKGEKVDLAEYLIPSQYNGNVRAIYGNEVQNKLDYEDEITITEYGKGEVSSDRYKIYTDQAMKFHEQKSKMKLVSRENIRYVYDEKSFHAAISTNGHPDETLYNFDRFVETGKIYSSFANLLGNRANTEKDYVVNSSYEKKKLDGKDCLINNVENIIAHRIKAKMEFIYCKPVGFTLHKLYEKDGKATEFKSLRKSEEN